MGIFLEFILSIPIFQFVPIYQMLLTDAVKLIAVFLVFQNKTPSLHRGRERVSGLRPLGGALDLCLIFDKHEAILLHSSSFVNDIELVHVSSFRESHAPSPALCKPNHFIIHNSR
jgi:hypothetical protein